MLGTKMTNIIWVKTDKKIEFKYMGCYKADSTKLIPHYLGNVTSTYECKNLAIKARFDTFALQFGGICWAGN